MNSIFKDCFHSALEKDCYSEPTKFEFCRSFLFVYASNKPAHDLVRQMFKFIDDTFLLPATSASKN